MRIIDIHAHPILFRKGGNRRDIDRLVQDSREQGVEKMVVLGDVLGFGQAPTAAEIATINNETARIVSWAPDFFLGFCFLNPTLGSKAAEREIERCAGELGFRGIKLELANNAASLHMRPVMRAAERLGLPLLQHTWHTPRAHDRISQSDPEDTVLLARRFPNVQVIMAHLTGCGYRGVVEARGTDNLVVDTSGAFPEANLLEYAVERLGADRIVYGSDLPIRETGVTIGRVNGSRLSAAQQRQILHTNARRILKL